jgi:hypothetical protein
MSAESIIARSADLLSERYVQAFGPFFERGFECLRAYAKSLSPPLRKVLENWPPFRENAQCPSTFKPHALWIGQFFGLTDPEILLDTFVASLLMEMHCCLQDRRIDGDVRAGLD